MQANTPLFSIWATAYKSVVDVDGADYHCDTICTIANMNISVNDVTTAHSTHRVHSGFSDDGKSDIGMVIGSNKPKVYTTVVEGEGDKTHSTYIYNIDERTSFNAIHAADEHGNPPKTVYEMGGAIYAFYSHEMGPYFRSTGGKHVYVDGDLYHPGRSTFVDFSSNSAYHLTKDKSSPIGEELPGQYYYKDNNLDIAALAINDNMVWAISDSVDARIIKMSDFRVKTTPISEKIFASRACNLARHVDDHNIALVGFHCNPRYGRMIENFMDVDILDIRNMKQKTVIHKHVMDSAFVENTAAEIFAY